MKKYIKIFCLILFVLFVLVITTSFAVNFQAERYTVTADTTAQQMLEALNAGKTLTGISSDVKDQNISLLCRERHWALWGGAGVYELTGETIVLPGTEENGLAKAYILAAPGYVKNDENMGDVTPEDERQYAWYFILGQTDGGKANDLYNIAMDYQNYKQTEEKDVKATVDPDTNTIVSGNNAIYGPIKVEYSYKKSTGEEKSDEWGGFDYAFFDESGANVSDKVKLCILSEGTYTPINSTQITSEDESNGYYRVKEITYNNEDLYVVTSDKTLSVVTLKMRENKVDYGATIYPIKGERYVSAGTQVLCSSCWYKKTGATTSMQSAVLGGKVLQLNGVYYVYTEMTTEEVYGTKGTNVYRINGVDYDATYVNGAPEFPSATRTVKYNDYCSSYCSTIHYTYGYDPSYGSLRYMCGACSESYAEYNSVKSHFESSHMSTVLVYTKKVYNFKTLGCGRDMGEKCSPCGHFIAGNTSYNSQGLHIVETTTEKNSRELKLDIDIHFSVTVSVEKQWDDEDNKYGNRLSSITVELLRNGKNTGQTLELSSENNWKGTFDKLDVVDDNGNKYTYSIKEISTPTGYITTKPTEDPEHVFVITNTLERTEIPVEKIWNDDNNRKGLRPSSINIELYRNGTKIDEVTLSGEGNSWKHTFTNLPKYVNKELAIYTIEEVEIPDGYVSEKTGDATSGFIVTNSHYDGYIEITGKVWVDGAAGKGNDIDLDGTYDQDDQTLGGIKVRLKDANHAEIPGSYSDEDGNFSRTDYAITANDGTYTIRVNYDNSKNVYKLYDDIDKVETKLTDAYVQFEYDGLKYTTVKNSNTGENTSKAIENEEARNKFDDEHSIVTPETSQPDQWGEDRNITAEVISFEDYAEKTMIEREETIKYCNGSRTEQTNPNCAWDDVVTNETSCGNCDGNAHSVKTSIDVEIMSNINLGLFEREQPEVMITSDINTVQVTMNNQKYTYIYNKESSKYNESDLKIVYQQRKEGQTQYTYSKPFNPADIAFIQDNPDALEVLVTYDVRVGNASTTLPITVDQIINVYDSNYTLVSAKMITQNGERNLIEENNVKTPEQSYYKKDTDDEKYKFNEKLLSGLGITVERQNELRDEESGLIKITYSVNVDAIKEKLLQGKATLDNVVEIETYSTQYGKDTLYAEQRIGERTDQPYAGYDYNSHPGNAGIYIKTEDNTNILQAEKLEPDTHIAPSFALVKSEEALKTISGTVWEDSRDNERDQDEKERLGNGILDEGECKVKNVKVELYEIIRDEEKNIIKTERAQLYDTKQNELKSAIAYTNEEGKYSLAGIKTGEYFMKFTYGDDISELRNGATTMDEGQTTVNARNYKSTIITEPTVFDSEKNTTFKGLFSKNYEDFTDQEKIWHIKHKGGYSIAVDNMQERLSIPDLQYDNFDNPQNMTAYTKPFETLVEFDEDGKSQVTDVTSGKIEGISNNLDTMDFAIIERPREDLIVQKTITNISLELANKQTITVGNPMTDELQFTKAMGFDQYEWVDTGEEAKDALPKELLTELDSELIQGATLKVDYAVKAINNNETDYDYGTLADYIEEENEAVIVECDKYITSKEKANYYYYGERTGLDKMKTTITFVDYIDSSLGYTADTNIWRPIKKDEIKTLYKGIICPNGIKAIERDEYQAFVSAQGAEIILGNDESNNIFETFMSTTRVLANKDGINYDNNAEIVKIDGKTARTIQESKEGTQVLKTYKPGNLFEDKHEQDDDRVSILMTSSTGVTIYTTPYIITGLIGLIVIVGVVIFIKKKVLIK